MRCPQSARPGPAPPLRRESRSGVGGGGGGHGALAQLHRGRVPEHGHREGRHPALAAAEERVQVLPENDHHVPRER